MNRTILFTVALLLFNSCKPIYRTASFEATVTPSAPNYADERFWAVLPGSYPKALKEITGEHTEKQTDVFFVYPTLLTDKKDPSWNADIARQEIREKVLSQSVKFQASAFAKAGNLYIPFYRQSHYKIYVPPYNKQEELSRTIAYADVRAAFQYYLDHYNQGRPIIIASHSQGSIMSAMLLKEFFDGTALKDRLVAAYIPGVKIQDKDFSSLKKMETPLTTGGYVSWNTYKQKNYPPTYEQWYKGGTTTNPISWDKSKNTDFDQHLGVLNADGAIYPKALKIEVVDGLIWSSVPKIPKRFLLSLIKSYHFADINLFWKDIEKMLLIVLRNGKKRIQMLDKIFTDCTTAWSKTKTNKKHPFRYFSLATVDQNGLPEARTVVLRKFDAKELLFTIYTDARTPKMTSLSTSPFAELLFYDASKLTQLRVRARCIEQSSDEIAFLQQHESAQKDYTTTIAPGQLIKSMDEVEYGEENHFIKLVFKAEKIDFLRLKRPNHQRAVFRLAEDQWEGAFVTP